MDDDGTYTQDDGTYTQDDGAYNDYTTVNSRSQFATDDRKDGTLDDSRRPRDKYGRGGGNNENRGGGRSRRQAQVDVGLLGQ